MTNWVDLAQELLEKISDFCITPENIRMLYVCKPRRSILKKSMRLELPWLMMLPDKEEKEDPDSRVFFSLSNQKIYNIILPEIRGKHCCGSFQNRWLMTLDEKLDICLWCKKKLNLHHQSTFKQQNYEEGLCSSEEIRDKHIHKVALSDDGFGYLVLCRIGGDAYTDIHVDALMEDVIHHKGHFYALDQVAAVYLLHIDDGFHPYREGLTPELEPPPPSLDIYLAPDIL